MLGQALGLSDADFDALKQDNYRDSPLFNEKEKATLWWAEEMTNNTAKSNVAVWKEMKRLFSDAEIVEISLNISMFAMINRLNDSFHTELESEEYNRRQHGAIGVTTDALDAYACRMCSASSNSPAA